MIRNTMGSGSKLGIILLGVAWLYQGYAAVKPLPVHTLVHDGLERRYAVYRPSGVAESGDVMLVLHGSGGDADRIRAFTGRRFEELADRHGFVVAYPLGFEGNWNGCRTASPFSANALNVDDVGFLLAVSRTVNEAANGKGRTFVFGFSGGGHLALRLALEARTEFTAVAAVGANLPAAGHSDCRASNEAPPAVLVINGTEDPINPYQGGPVVLPAALGGARLGPVLSASDTLAVFTARGSYRQAQPEQVGAGVTRVRWQGRGQPDLALVTVAGGGHTIPQDGVSFPPVAGPHTTTLDAPAAVWQFFARQNR